METRTCCKCGVKSSEVSGITFHRFPKPTKASTFLSSKVWAYYCFPEKDWSSDESLIGLSKKHVMLCSQHFLENDFTEGPSRRLRHFSIPKDAQHILGKLRSNISTPSTSETASMQQDLHIDEVASKSCEEKRRCTPRLPARKLQNFNPREQQLYIKCRKLVKETVRLRNKIKNIKKTNILEEILDDDNINKLMDLKLTTPFIELLKSQLINCRRPKTGRRWSLDQKIMALSLFKKSPATYKILKQMFCLPSESTLNQLLNKTPLNTGINSHIFASLKDMAKKQRKEDNICVLSFDEMAIRKNLSYNKKNDQIEGYQDHANHGRSQEIATNALVFMLTGVRKKWKQPVSFYFSSKTVTSSRLSVLIKENIDECLKTGLHIIGTVCDMSTVNVKALELLGSTTENPYFNFKGIEVVTIFDPPHLLKCFRNNFMKYDIECTTNVKIDGKYIKGIAKWSHIKEFYEIDNQNPHFVFAPKLTKSHINPNSKEKMRVKLAAQVCSHSVAAGMFAKVASNELPSDASTTATLLSKIDQLFDAVNADTPDLRGGKKCSTNMTPSSPHKKLFYDMKKFISEMNFIGSHRPPSQNGWIQTINGLERLWSNINSIYRIESLSTRRINKGALENFFGCIRYHCGSNNNPTVGQFIAGFKTSLISNLRQNSRRKNCEDDFGTLVENFKKFLLTDNTNAIVAENENQIANVTSTLEPYILQGDVAVEEATPEAQACAYVCGFIIKKNKNECQTCKNIFLTDDIDPVHTFTNFKEYDSIKNSLKYVNKKMICSVENSASLINTFLESNSWKSHIYTSINNLLMDVDFNFLNKCEEHSIINQKFIIDSTYFICIKRFTVLRNREFSEEEKTKSLKRKIQILSNK